MLLPSSMRINDPFSMKLEKVEPPPAPAKLTPYQEFEQISRDVVEYPPFTFGVDLADKSGFTYLLQEQTRCLEEIFDSMVNPPVVEQSKLRFKRYEPQILADKFEMAVAKARLFAKNRWMEEL